MLCADGRFDRSQVLGYTFPTQRPGRHPAGGSGPHCPRRSGGIAIEIPPLSCFRGRSSRPQAVACVWRMDRLTLKEVARRIDVSEATLRRWVREGLVPVRNGTWTPATAAHARVVARLRERGHSVDEIR